MQAVDKQKNAKKKLSCAAKFECKYVFNNEFDQYTYCRI